MPTIPDYSSEAIGHAQVIFDYLRLEEKPIPGDAIMALGSFDMDVPQYSGRLYAKALAFRIIFSGGSGAGSADLPKPEAIAFFDYLQDKFPAIRPGVVILEPKSTNTGENIRFTQELLEEKYQDFRLGREVKKVVLVTTSYRQRRAYLTCKKVVPKVLWTNCPPPATLEGEIAKYAYKNMDLVQLMLGELDRIEAYPEKGWTLPEFIPEEVAESAAELRKMIK